LQRHFSETQIEYGQQHWGRGSSRLLLFGTLEKDIEADQYREGESINSEPESEDTNDHEEEDGPE
jgi:hypothetical protein